MRPVRVKIREYGSNLSGMTGLMLAVFTWERPDDDEPAKTTTTAECVIQLDNLPPHESLFIAPFEVVYPEDDTRSYRGKNETE